MAEVKKVTRVSKKDQKEILRLHNTGAYTDKEIAEEVGHSEGKVGYWIRKLKGTRRMVRVAKVVESPKTGALPASKQKTTAAKEYILTIDERYLHPDTINLLQTTKSSDEFVKGYYQKRGFDTGASVKEIINAWDHRKQIIKLEKEKELERKRKELLLATGAANHPVKEEPIKNDKRSAFADEGELLVKINHRLAEMIIIMEEILKVQKDTYILFKEKMDGGKKYDGNAGETAKPTAS